MDIKRSFKRFWVIFLHIIKMRKTQAILLAIFIFFSLFILVLRPSFIGFSTYQQLKNSNYTIEDYTRTMSELQENIKIKEINLSSSENFRKELFTEMEKYIVKLTSCEGELMIVKSDLDSSSKLFEKEKTELMNRIENKEVELQECIKDKKSSENKLTMSYVSEINDLKKEVQKCEDNLEDEYNLLAKNSANNICCKSRIDNPSIDSYILQNHKIVCMSGGKNIITC